MSQRVVVVGCGGIGGVIAARLARAGVDVTPVTGNPAIAEAVKKDGFRVQEASGETWTARAPRRPLALLQPGDGPFDVALFCTKATTLVDAVRTTLPCVAAGGTLVACQNGLPEELIAGVAGPGRVLGCVVVFGATMTAPGQYEVTSKGTLQLGRPSPEAPELREVAALLGKAAPVALLDDLVGARWSKLAINCATSTLGAIGGERLGALLRRRFVRRLVLEVWTEIAQVARASGVKMAPVGGTIDIEKMALTPAEQAATLGSPALAWKHSLILAVGIKYRRMRSSMLVALERGRVPEIDYLNGEIVRRGEALGVPTPVNRRLCAAVRALIDRRETSSIDLLRRVYDETVGAGYREAAA